MKKDPLEKGVRTRARRGSIQRGLLGVLAMGGLLTVAAAAPKVVQLIRREHLDYLVPLDNKQRLHETAARLKKKGLIEFRIEGGHHRMRITDKGKAELARIQTLERPLKAPKRWDARWRIVIFDVPERKRTTRNRIRELVRKLGFMRLQDSVWVYPYDCEEVVAVLKADLKVGREVLYLIADAIEFDRPLRQRFGLPLTT